MIASKYKANYCHYACFPPEIRKIMSKSGSWINNHLFTYTPYNRLNFGDDLHPNLDSGFERYYSAIKIETVSGPCNTCF